jgi:crotonobetainyl-CoA:carnitine CoA-transferase CaiB-like acyl-CoA transferase
MLGEHTDEILTALGYSPPEIAALRGTGAAG